MPNDELTGFHYASLNNWRSIQESGLKPYDIIKPALRSHIGTERVRGIWVWKNELIDLAHTGSVLYQMATKNTTQVVLLSVIYKEEDVLSVNDGIVVLYHSGTIGNLEYHEGKDEAVIATKPISIKKISLLQQYDLLEIWKK